MLHLYKSSPLTQREKLLARVIDPFNNDIICGKALKYVSFVLNKFSQIANVEPKLTTYWYKGADN